MEREEMGKGEGIVEREGRREGSEMEGRTSMSSVEGE